MRMVVDGREWIGEMIKRTARHTSEARIEELNSVAPDDTPNVTSLSVNRSSNLKTTYYGSLHFYSHTKESKFSIRY